MADSGHVWFSCREPGIISFLVQQACSGPLYSPVLTRASTPSGPLDWRLLSDWPWSEVSLQPPWAPFSSITKCEWGHFTGLWWKSKPAMWITCPAWGEHFLNSIHFSFFSFFLFSCFPFSSAPFLIPLPLFSSFFLWCFDICSISSVNFERVFVSQWELQVALAYPEGKVVLNVSSGPPQFLGWRTNN